MLVSKHIFNTEFCIQFSSTWRLSPRGEERENNLFMVYQDHRIKFVLPRVLQTKLLKNLFIVLR
jgi:hypothetical protein